MGTYLPEPEIRVYTSGVCTTAVWQRYLGLTIMRLVANGTDTRIPADVTTCKMAAAHDAVVAATATAAAPVLTSRSPRDRRRVGVKRH